MLCLGVVFDVLNCEGVVVDALGLAFLHEADECTVDDEASDFILHGVFVGVGEVQPKDLDEL